MPGSETSWVLTPHTCRSCLGRVLRHETTFRCADCGAQTADSPVGICGCGIAAKAMQRRTGPHDAAFHCAPNPHKSAQSPAEIVVMFGDAVVMGNAS